MRKITVCKKLPLTSPLIKYLSDRAYLVTNSPKILLNLLLFLLIIGPTDFRQVQTQFYPIN